MKTRTYIISPAQQREKTTLQFPSLCYSVTPGAQALSTCGCRAAAGTGPWYAASCAHPPLASSKKPFANAATRSVLFAL